MRSRLNDHLETRLIDGDYIPTEFNLYTKNQVNNILYRGMDDQAISRKNVEAITIDGKESLDLDDAIWAERRKEGYCVWIHISDVSEYIPIYSPLDLEAFKRTTSIYRRDNIINMIPEELSNGIITLDENGVKKVMTLQIDLDNEGQVKNYLFYESNFKSLKRYDYESFGEDYENKDSQMYDTIHLLQEISNKLRINRLTGGAIVGYRDEDRRLYLGNKIEKENDSYSAKISHDIIESIMVLANTITGRYLAEKDIDAIYKQHLGINELSFYKAEQGYHKGLGVENYTNFTSPIRRYIDIIIHRIIKTLDRGEQLPYTKGDLELIAEHSNNTRLKVEVLGTQAVSEMKGEEFLKRTKKRLGKDPEVYEMKDYIRESVAKKKRMPDCMKKAIMKKIDITSISDWGWCIGVILFGKDKDLKEYLRDKILNDKFLKPGRMMHLIANTQILRGGDTIFEVIEHEDNNCFKVEVFLHGNKITSCSKYAGKLGDISHIKGEVRKNAISKIFDYFIGL